MISRLLQMCVTWSAGAADVSNLDGSGTSVFIRFEDASLMVRNSMALS
jgi:hypothetical protein